MPLIRYQIRNEYSLADPDLYRAADKDDPEALLEGVAMAGLVGVLRQLGDLAEFAAELFHDLHEEVMATAARGHGLMTRLQQLEAEVPSIEKAFLSQTNHSLYLYNAGIDWHPNLQMDQNMITRGDLPRFVMDSYEECRGPPRLFLLDKFDIAGAGACLKRYSDPSFFKVESTSSETTQTEGQREKKARKIKKKASRWRNGETSEVVPTSHSKLHQLLSEEHSQTENSAPTHRVKLKRRHSSCSLTEPTTGKSYLERFLGTCSPESKLANESSASPLRLKMESSNSGELVPEIHEICSGSPENKLGKRDRSPASPSRRNKLPEQSFDELGGDVIEDGIFKLSEATPDIKLQKIPCTLHKVEDQKEPVADEDSKIEASTNGYRSEDITSEMDNYVDAHATMESEMGTDIDGRKNERGFCNIEMKGEDSDTSEEQHKRQSQFSDSLSTGSSIASDDGDNSFKKERFSLSYFNSPSNLTENVRSDSDAAAKVHPSTEILSAEIVDMCSGKHSDNGDVKPRSPERLVYWGTDSESGKASCDFSLADSPHPFSHLSPGESDSKFQLARPDLIVVSSGFSKAVNVGSSSNAEDDGKGSGGDLPCVSNISDLPSQLRDNLLPLKGQPVEMLGDGNPDVSCDDALMHPSNILDIDYENKDDGDASQEMLPTKETENLLNGELDIPDSVILPTEAQCFQEQDLEACPATQPTESVPDCLTHDQLDDVKPDCIVADTKNVISSTGDKSEIPISMANPLEVGGFSELKSLKITDEVPPAELELASVGIDCSEVETSNSNLVVLSDKSACDVEDGTAPDSGHLSSSDTEENSDPPLDFPSRCTKSDTPESASVAEVNSHLAHLVSGANYEEVVDEDTIMDHNRLGFPSEDNLTLQNECNSNGDSDQDKLETTEVSIERHLIGQDTQKESAVDTTGFILDLSNPESNKPFGSELFSDAQRAQNLLKLSDGTNGLLSLGESDQDLEPKQPPQSHLSDCVEETKPSAIHSLPELKALSEKGLEVTADQLKMSSLHEDKEYIELSKSDSERPELPNRVDFDGCNTPSKYSSMDPLCQPSEPRFSLFPTTHKFENSEASEAPHHQPLDSKPNTPVLDFSLPDHNAVQDIKEEMQSLPLLPCMQWRVGKLQQGSVTSDGEVLEPSVNPFWQPSPTTEEKEDQQGFPAFEGGLAEPVNPFLPLPTADDEKPQQGSQMLGGELMQPHINAFFSLPAIEHEEIQQDIPTLDGKTVLPLNPFLPLPAIEDRNPESGSLTSGVEMQPSLDAFHPSQYTSLTSDNEVAQPLNLSTPIPIRDDEKSQNMYIPLHGLVVKPPNSFTRPLSIEDDKPKHGSLNLEEEMTNVEDGKPDGNLRTRIPRPRDPLIEAVASHDKSMLRKVTERVRPQFGPKVEERDSLLEQIRNKSFNLKPAVATRPSIQGPRTNLKVVAILEKANAIRQALAGSDDDDDEDSWSDS